ncbi:MAG TPA: hypothetical protein VK167_02820 [Flavipsychrobacter sp.]|nr:hypothetical protein [Flavipsychrobacter sp.]
MKELLILKRIDFVAQLLAIAIPMLLAITTKNDEIFFMIYFSLGGVQVLSCLINKASLDKEYRDGARTGYEIALLIITVLGLIALFDAYNPSYRGGNFAMMYLFVMLLAGFIMGMLYLIISANEMIFIAKLVKRHELIK